MPVSFRGTETRIRGGRDRISPSRGRPVWERHASSAPGCARVRKGAPRPRGGGGEGCWRGRGAREAPISQDPALSPRCGGGPCRGRWREESQWRAQGCGGQPSQNRGPTGPWGYPLSVGAAGSPWRGWAGLPGHRLKVPNKRLLGFGFCRWGLPGRGSLAGAALLLAPPSWPQFSDPLRLAPATCRRPAATAWHLGSPGWAWVLCPGAVPVAPWG